MADQQVATPQPDATPEAPSIDDRIAGVFGFGDETAPDEQPDEGQAAEGGDDDELPADPLDGEGDAVTPQDVADFLELDRNGERRKVSKEEAKNLAQMGWDYSEKNRALKEEYARVQQEKELVTAKANLAPAVVDAAADVRYFERALQQYEKVDWVRYAQENPIDYASSRAQFDQLRDGMNQALGQFQKVFEATKQVDAGIAKTDIQKEYNVLFTHAPELRDSKRLAAEQTRVRSFLENIGAQPSDMAIVDRNAVAWLIVRNAARYDAAMKSKQDKQQGINKAPPVIRPGAAPQRTTEATKKQEAIKTLRQAKDPTVRKKAFDEVMALKLKLK